MYEHPLRHPVFTRVTATVSASLVATSSEAATSSAGASLPTDSIRATVKGVVVATRCGCGWRSLVPVAVAAAAATWSALNSFVVRIEKK